MNECSFALAPKVVFFDRCRFVKLAEKNTLFDTVTVKNTRIKKNKTSAWIKRQTTKQFVMFP
jgi:hypothetical protein